MAIVLKLRTRLILENVIGKFFVKESSRKIDNYAVFKTFLFKLTIFIIIFFIRNISLVDNSQITLLYILNEMIVYLK